MLNMKSLKIENKSIENYNIVGGALGDKSKEIMKMKFIEGKLNMDDESNKKDDIIDLINFGKDFLDDADENDKQ